MAVRRVTDHLARIASAGPALLKSAPGVIGGLQSAADDVRTLAAAGVLGRIRPKALKAIVRTVRTEGVGTTLVYAGNAAERGDEPVFVTDDRTITWSQALDRIDRLTTHLLSLGVGPGKAVAVMLPTRPEFLETVTAAIRTGATASFVNPKSPAPDAQALFERTDTRVVVTHRPEVVPDGIVALTVGDDYERAIASSQRYEPTGKVEPGRVVIFTSGTTGKPKGAVRRLDGGSSLSLLAGLLRLVPLRADDVHMVVCPMYHSSGSGFSTISLGLGNQLVFVESFSPKAFCEAVQRHKVTTTAVVPTMLHKLCAWEGASDYDLSSLRVVVCTGSPLRAEVRDRARELVGDVIYDLYGSTEMGWVSVATPDDHQARPGTVGKPAPGVTVRIKDTEWRDVPQGELGEIWVTSDVLMESYLGDPDLDNERTREGHMTVFDVGYVDPDGYLHVVDRADDMIISGGVNVYPAESEVALSAHPKVREASVLGVPDPEWGQRIVAAVIVDGDVTPAELEVWCKDRVGYAAVPKEFRIVDDLPRNDVGKVSKRHLVESWTAGGGATG